jgi:hypothetical protein
MIITILRKPLEGSVADNVLKHGCGGLNIDATRVGLETMVSRSMGSLGVMHDDNWESKPIEAKEATGRWPANFILMHKEGCELKGTKKIKEGKANKDKGGSLREVGLYEDGLKTRAVDHFQGEETVSDWACVEGCPVKELDRQSGHLKSGEVKAGSYKQWGKNGIYGEGKEHPATYYGDEGGASRFFKQFKKGNKQ